MRKNELFLAWTFSLYFPYQIQPILLDRSTAVRGSRKVEMLGIDPIKSDRRYVPLYITWLIAFLPHLTTSESFENYIQMQLHLLTRSTVNTANVHY